MENVLLVLIKLWVKEIIFLCTSTDSLLDNQPDKSAIALTERVLKQTNI